MSIVKIFSLNQTESSPQLSVQTLNFFLLFINKKKVKQKLMQAMKLNKF